MSVVVEKQSCWTLTGPRRTRPPLDGNTTADVCIVGAGIAGMSIAYELVRHGQKVVVLDDGPIGGGQTAVTTAHLTNVFDRRFFDIVRFHGEERARLAVASHQWAVDRIETIARNEEIDCDFSRLDGYLFAHETEALDILDRELATIERLGLDGVVTLERGPRGAEILGPCLRFPRQARFHPLKYLAGLAEAVRHLGGSIFGGTHVTSVSGGDKAEVTVRGGHTVRAKHVVVATNTPINDMFAIHTKQAPYLSYVVGFECPGDSIADGLFWDTADPFHYVRLQPAENADDANLLIVGGEDHKTGQADDGEERFERLEAWARHRFSHLGEVRLHWAGQLMESADGLAFIGRNPGDDKNVYVVTGDSGLGMTHGTISGRLISDLILGVENNWARLYNPGRLLTSAGPAFVKENVNVALQYTDWITPGEVASADEVEPGQGAILREGLKKVAVYRDEQGNLTRLSATCPHLMCVVHWNSAETTWDCPCHGSRFSAVGKVLNGPANVDLKSAE